MPAIFMSIMAMIEDAFLPRYPKQIGQDFQNTAIALDRFRELSDLIVGRTSSVPIGTVDRDVEAL